MNRTARNLLYLGLIVLGGILLTLSILWLVYAPSVPNGVLVVFVGAVLFTISRGLIREATKA